MFRTETLVDDATWYLFWRAGCAKRGCKIQVFYDRDSGMMELHHGKAVKTVRARDHREDDPGHGVPLVEWLVGFHDGTEADEPAAVDQMALVRAALGA